VIPTLRGALVLAWGAVSAVGCILAQLPAMLVTGSADFSIWLARNVWSASNLWLAGVKLDVRQLAPFPEGPAIFASNHESAIDIWVLLRIIPRNSLRFVAKRELFGIPIFGWYLRKARYVEVDRQNHTRAVAALARGAELVRGGTSLIVFPEGTRSADARVHPFKKGPFVLAMEAGVPIVPVAISGAAAVTPKRAIEVHPGTVRVAFGKPLSPRDFPDRDALLREVRRRIIVLHVELGGAGGELGDAVAGRGLEGRSA
jgi:1-acyl-sn-glycerol-3-phosphate acyltransferase